ncbi:HNH endonuclease [Pleionea sp. CnH1-48]|nr:HNH endonuclease signature motif containing protein [Pleionea sp. CnH1-48]MCO7226001.1 HNH endonuclease [Pleionea sp. CnH1-48]
MCLAISRIQAAQTVDHITPKSRGGTDEPDNLQSLCYPCHDYKTAREA